MDTLEALGERGADARSAGPFAAQSRDEPLPYILPATTTSGVSAAS